MFLVEAGVLPSRTCLGCRPGPGNEVVPVTTPVRPRHAQSRLSAVIAASPHKVCLAYIFAGSSAPFLPLFVPARPHPGFPLHCRSSLAVFKVLSSCRRAYLWLPPVPQTRGSTTTSRVRCAVNWRTQMGQPGRAGDTYNARTLPTSCGCASFCIPLLHDAQRSPHILRF